MPQVLGRGLMAGLHECRHCHYRFENPGDLEDHEEVCGGGDDR